MFIVCRGIPKSSIGPAALLSRLLVLYSAVVVPALSNRDFEAPEYRSDPEKVLPLCSPCGAALAIIGDNGSNMGFKTVLPLAIDAKAAAAAAAILGEFGSGAGASCKPRRALRLPFSVAKRVTSCNERGAAMELMLV